MLPAGNATPLIALDVVAIDSETTGLDPRSARILDLAAVHVTAGAIDALRSFQRLVRPDVPIPAAATRIHGLDDAAVAAALPFAAIWPEFRAAIGDTIVVGHMLGFDLAVLRRECERAGLAWARPRTLDTHLLAQLVEPDLAGFTLEQVAAWLGVAVEGRHSALGDATTAARIFLALLPKLREGNIRTLAEAERACAALADALERQHRAGWAEAMVPPERSEPELSRIDSYPYRHRIRDAMSAPAKFVAPDVTLDAALATMARERCSSLFVHPAAAAAPRCEQTGIVTERDVLRALADHGVDALALPVAGLMSKPLASVPAEDFVYRAIARMSRLKIRHLGVVDGEGRVVGALSARDLLRLRADEAVSLGDEIDEAPDIHGLGRAWAKLPHVAAALVAEGVEARNVAAVISRELAALTRRAAILAERRLVEASAGAPPCGYAIAVLGSAGRGESLLAMDQDNALVFAEGAPGGAQDRWFEALGVHVSDILHEVGVPYCKGGVMARNAPWRGSLATWRERIAGWIGRSHPPDLLSVDIFFDLRGVHGGGLADTLRREGLDLARGEAAFAKLLVEAAGPVPSSVGFFGTIKSEQGRIDLKRAGLFGIVSAARALAICHHIGERATPARLAGIKALGLGGDDLDALDAAHELFMSLILAQQLDDVAHGVPPSNAVSLKRLTRAHRARLRSALDAVGNLDTLTRDLLFKA
jgi:CBS domain-containing protein